MNAPDTSETAKRRRWRWTFWTLAVVLAAAYAALLVIPPPQPALIVSPETTYLTSPLYADGSVDYMIALSAKFGEGVAADNNALAPC